MHSPPPHGLGDSGFRPGNTLSGGPGAVLPGHETHGNRRLVCVSHQGRLRSLVTQQYMTNTHRDRSTVVGAAAPRGTAQDDTSTGLPNGRFSRGHREGFMGCGFQAGLPTPGHRSWLFSSLRWFSNFSRRRAHLRGLSEPVAGATPAFLPLEVWQSLRICIPNGVSGEADAAGLGMTL